MSCNDLEGYAFGPAGESPPNYDLLPNTNFRMIFPKAKIATFFLTDFDLPPIRVSPVNKLTPIVDTNEVGEKLKYDPFTITFLVDSKMENFRQIYDWMKRMTVRGSNVGEKDNVILTINGVQTMTFFGAWPSSIGNLKFTTTATSTQYIIGEALINYDYMEFNT
jgi:hypothetical protein